MWSSSGSRVRVRPDVHVLQVSASTVTSRLNVDTKDDISPHIRQPVYCTVDFRTVSIAFPHESKGINVPQIFQNHGNNSRLSGRTPAQCRSPRPLPLDRYLPLQPPAANSTRCPAIIRFEVALRAGCVACGRRVQGMAEPRSDPSAVWRQSCRSVARGLYENRKCNSD